MPPGAYCNFLRVRHTQGDFSFDFGQLHADGAGAFHTTTIVTSPFWAKTMLEVLQKQIQKYELEFGEIPLQQAKEKLDDTS